MIFEPCILQPPLNTYIESIFYFKHFMPDHFIERVVPTGHIFILFELDGIPRKTYDKTTLEENATYKEAWVSGMQKEFLSISAPQDSEMLAIQFKPGMAFPFFYIPINQLNNKVIAATELFGSEITDVRNEILKSDEISGKFELVTSWLECRLNKKKEIVADLHDIGIQFMKQPLSNHKTIVETYPKSHKHLINQFKKYYGLTPKVFHRIMRFNEVLQLIQSKQDIEWSQITYLCGYSDQSHFIKEFKSFSGFNPQEFINKNYNMGEVNFFPVK